MKYKITIDTETPIDYITGKLKVNCKVLDVENVKEIKQRTSQQNRSLYLYFRLLAEELNNSGYDMKKTIRSDIDISWTPESVKQYLWLPIMKTMTGKTSTAKMDTNNIDRIYDVLNKTIAERTGVSILFPSIDNMSDIEYN